MAINKWVITTYNASSGANPAGGVPTSAAADGGSVVVGWDSAVITNFDQLRACLRSIDNNIRGQLGPV
jgi:hypothetical protein